MHSILNLVTEIPSQSDSVPSAWVLVYSELDCPAEWSSSQGFSNNGSSCQDHTFPLHGLDSDSALSVSILFCLSHNRLSLVSATSVPTASVGPCHTPFVLSWGYFFICGAGHWTGSPSRAKQVLLHWAVSSSLFTSHFVSHSHSIAQAGLEFTLWHWETLNLTVFQPWPLEYLELHGYTSRPG